MMGIGIISLLGKLHKWDEGAIWFDGSSLGIKNKHTRVRSQLLADGFHTAVFVFAIAVYLTVTIPALKAVVNPAEADPEFTFDQNLGLLGAGNTIIAGLLVLILVMQASCSIVNKAANEAERFSCSGWARVCEAYRSQRAGCRGEGKGQGRQIGVKGRLGVENSMYSCCYLFVCCSRRPSCTLAPILFNGCCRGVLRNG